MTEQGFHKYASRHLLQPLIVAHRQGAARYPEAITTLAVPSGRINQRHT